MRAKERKDLLRGQGHVRLGQCSHPRHLTAELMERGRPAQRPHLAHRVSHVGGDCEGLVAALQGLVGVPEVPENARQEREARHAIITPVAEKGVGAVSFGFVQSKALLEVASGGD